MAASRIFVRGLPPGLSEEDFRKHFARGAHVTDLQLKPQRRIGYVGFETPEAAAKAVKFFHKSFIRMSRLHVELAQELSQAQKANRTPTSRLTNALSQSAPQVASLPNTLKRKRVENQNTQSASLGVSSGADNSDGSEAGPTSHNHNARRDSANAHNIRETERPPFKTTADSKEEPVSALRPQQDAPQDTSVTQIATDADWMRSRTTRLLGLADEESEDDAAHQGRDLSESSQPADNKEVLQATTAPATSPAGQDWQDNDSVESEIKVTQDENLILEAPGSLASQESGRLFLRNLAYNASEEDLRGLLDQYGSLQEVI